MNKKLSALSLAVILTSGIFTGEQGMAQPPAAAQPAAAPAAPASKGNISYFLGFDFGSNLASRQINEQDLDTKELVAGLVDALAKKKPRLSEAEIDSVIESVNELIKKKILESAKSNLDRATKYLAENKTKDGVQTTKSGLQYKVVTAGSGKQPTVSDTVTVHYEGKTIDGEIFDSSIQRGQPAQFQVGQVVPGFGEALQRMKVGDKWIVTIPPDLGYGENGAGSSIGPNEVLIFQLELLEVGK